MNNLKLSYGDHNYITARPFVWFAEKKNNHADSGRAEITERSLSKLHFSAVLIQNHIHFFETLLSKFYFILHRTNEEKPMATFGLLRLFTIF